MKRRLAVIAALFLGMGGFSLGGNVLAGELEESPAPTESPVPTESPAPTESPVPEESMIPTESPDLTESPVPEESMAPTESPVPEESMAPTESSVPTESSTPTESPVPTESPAPTESPMPTESPAPTESPVPAERAAVVSLQIPQKLGVVIDPWEVHGKGQIYSETYVIRNDGETAGLLTLSFLCRTGEQGGAVFRESEKGLYEGDNKQIFIEMVFGDGERMSLSQEGAMHQAFLEPGEELQVWFSGGVNEAASEPWQDGDVLIEGIYSWESVDRIGSSIAEEITEDSSGESQEE